MNGLLSTSWNFRRRIPTSVASRRNSMERARRLFQDGGGSCEGIALVESRLRHEAETRSAHVTGLCTPALFKRSSDDAQRAVILHQGEYEEAQGWVTRRRGAPGRADPRR